MLVEKWANYRYYLLAGLCLAFVCFKYPYLSLPAYWDEAWVYIPALMQMADTTPSLLPGVIDLDYSRGHPLLFHFLGGIWLKIFGNSLSSFHSFPLFISLFCLFYSYKLSDYLYGTKAAIVTVILLLVSEIFFVQSGLVLPEMLMATLFITSVYYYLRNQFWGLAISLSLLVLTKESGIILAISIILVEAFFAGGNQTKFKRRPIYASLLSIAVFIGFLVLNKLSYGWYFYPGHTEMLNLDLGYNMQKIKRVAVDVFSHGEHFLYVFPIVLLLVLNYIKKSKQLWFLCGAITGFLALTLFKKYPGWNYQIAIAIGLMTVCTFVLIYNMRYRYKDYHFRFTVLLLVFAFGYILFSSINFYTVRYILSLIPFLVIVSSMALIKLYERFGWLVLVYGFLIIGLHAFKIYRLDNAGDNDLGYTLVVDCHSQLAEQLASIVEPGDRVKSDFLIRKHFENPALGYYKTDYPSINLVTDNSFKYYIYEDILWETKEELERYLTDYNMKLLFECKNKNIYSAIYLKE